MEAIEAFIIKEILSWLANRLAGYFAAMAKDKADHEKAVNQSAQDNEKATHINEGSTSDEVDAAIADQFRHV